MPSTTDNLRLANASSTHRRGAGRADAGFTLAELLVAVSVVIVLSVAMGQVFSAVGKLVGTGAAVSEVDGLARAIERQMRDDFESMSRMKADETFFAIRSRTLGDMNNNGTLETNNGEKVLYLSQADKDADLTAGISNPYQRDTTGKQIGRGITARLDEMIFLSRASEKAKFKSAQQGGIEEEPVLADVARIYYGHGLRPATPKTPQGTAYDPTRPLALTNRPVRRLFPDTQQIAVPTLPNNDAADAPTQQNLAWGKVFGEPYTRNEFAADFPLLRQPLLLVGGTAAGNNGLITQRDASINGADGFRRRTFVPYIRDMETQARDGVSVNAAARFILGNGWRYPDPTFSSPRMLRWGRTDICAQSRDDVQRWLEGVETYDNRTLTSDQYNPAEASAFTLGILEDSETDGDATPDAPPYVWKYAANGFAGPDAALFYRLPEDWGLGQTGNLNPNQAVMLTTARLRSAVAGVFSRMLCEPSATNVQPRLNLTSGQGPRAQVDNIADPVPADTAMDQHAVLAPRCSNFEIAWSDGSRWTGADPLFVYLGATRTPENLIATYMPGDLVWFDSVFTRRQYRTLFLPPTVPPQAATAAPDSEVLPQEGDATNLAITTPNSSQPAVPSSDRSAAAVQPLNALLLVTSPTYAAVSTVDGRYDPYRSGGDETEYMAIWGFRRPAVDVRMQVPPAEPRQTLTWSESVWEKPKFIRVRMTLHDSLNRISAGKAFEYVFSIEPAAN